MQPVKHSSIDIVAASDAVRSLLRTLIGFDTTSHLSNLELIDFVRDYLSGLGVQSQLFFNDDKSKANLYASIGPGDRAGIALSGHTDVVPVAGQDWRYDPWQATQADGRIYGRGACDMKGFIAAVLALVPKMTESELQRPVHLCLSYDEEVGCVGVRSLLAFMAEQEIKPLGCVVGEPTAMQVVTGHKGKLSVRCQVKGHACHSALAPYGVNAVEAAAKVVAYIGDMAHRSRTDGPFDDAFDVPYTTIQTGVISGGTALNIVPSDCQFEFEFRHLPNDDPDLRYAAVRAFTEQELAPAMRAVAVESGFTFEERSRFASLDTAPDADIVELLKKLTASEHTRKVAFGTEGGGFNAIGIPTVVCGPGSITEAHKPDEFVTLEQLARCEQLISRLVDHLSGVDA